MLLSVVIPVYNTAVYLERCVESVLRQGFGEDELEVIVINDGSTDDSLSVARALAERYKPVSVISKPNEGLSLTRNAGIDASRGKYIYFLDSDDYLEPGVFRSLIAEMDAENLDMLGFSMRAVDEQGNEIAYDYAESINQRDQDIVSGRAYLLSENYAIMVWAYIFRREFLDKHALRMIPIVHEDEEFMPRCFYLAERICFRRVLAYNYTQRQNSIIGQVNPQKDFDLLTGCASLLRFAESRMLPDDKSVYRVLENRIRGISLVVLYRHIEQRTGSELDLLRHTKTLKLGKTLYSCDHRRLLYHLSPRLFLVERRYRLRRKQKRN